MFIFYVAGKLADAQKINQDIIQPVLEQKFKISYNWTEHVNDDNKEQLAINEINAIKNCSAVIIYITDPEYEYRGTNTELGAALGTGTKVYVIDPFEESSFSKNNFLNHPLVSRFKTLDEVLNQFKKVY